MTSIQHLLAALRADANPAQWFAALQSAPVDQDDLAVMALALGLAPLLHYRLEGWGAALPDPKAHAKLTFARKVEEARQVALRAQLAEVLARLPVPPIVLKGAYLAEKVYPAPGLRPMNDIDLLFRPQDLPAAVQVLRELGYGSKEKSPDLGPGITKHTTTFKRPVGAGLVPAPDLASAPNRDNTPNPYLSSNGSRMIEPHRSLEESWFGLKCDLTPGMWERSVEIEIAGAHARALSHEDMLLHQCVHLAFHLIMGAPSFVQLADLLVFVERVPLDWAAFVARAKELHASGYAYAALRLAARELAMPIPADVMDVLAADSPRAVRLTAETLSLADVIRRTQKPPLRTIPQRLRRGLADRAETARWAHSPAEWLRVWGTLVDVRRTDTWRLINPQTSKSLKH
ncbi:MAG: nucleotidyltransferase domain-containing protein [Anaerolineales bacterium]